MKIKEAEKVSGKVTKMVFGGLLIALGILLPQAFHIFGTAGGGTFLPCLLYTSDAADDIALV